MQFQEKCNSCKIDFDEEYGIPFLLPCNHSVCQTCLMNDFRRQNQNKCSICQKISNVPPSKLHKNEQIIQEVQQRTQKQITDILESLGFYKHNLKQIMQTILQSQSSVIFEVISLINKSLFPLQKQSFMEISSKVREINHLIKELEKHKKEKIVNQIQIFKDQQYSQLESILKELENKGRQQIQNLEKQKEMILYLINQLFSSSANQEVEEFKQTVNTFFDFQKNIDQYTKNQNQQEKNINKQERQSDFIHYFVGQGQNLHLFDVKTEQYYKINLEQESPSF